MRLSNWPSENSGSLPEGVDVRPDSPGCLAVYRGATMIGWMHDQRDGNLNRHGQGNSVDQVGNAPNNGSTGILPGQPAHAKDGNG